LRFILLAAGLAALPLSLRALWAEPAEPADEPAAESSEEPAAAKSRKDDDAIEERLKRLEKMIESLAKKLPGAPSTDQSQDVSGDVRELTMSPDFPQEHNIAIELADLVQETTLKLELTKTNYARREAASRQVADLKAAYEKGSATLDQLLESQRRLAEAETSHLRANCDLVADPVRREYLFAAACLYNANSWLVGARDTWRQVRQVSGVESQAEAQAREQFYQFKAQAQTLLNEFHRADARRRYTQGLPPAKANTTESMRHHRLRVKHYEVAAERDKARLAVARTELANARQRGAEGEVPADEIQKLEEGVARLERRLLQRYEELAAAMELMLEQSKASQPSSDARRR
jgi:hypothetical protein